MLRAQYERRGPVPEEVIEAVEVETPRPAAGEALLEVIAAPVNTPTMAGPRNVAIGIKALRAPCLNHTTRSERPLALAVRT